MAKYYFADIESQTVSSGYTTVVIVDHMAEIPPLKVVKIVDDKETAVEIEDTEAMLLAEKLGGVIEAKPVKKSKPAEPAEVNEQ